jgi:sugar transferase EpsL
VSSFKELLAFIYKALMHFVCTRKSEESKYLMVKRIFDLALTIPMTILLLPFFATIAILSRLFFGSPIIFKQVRPGLNGNPFIIYKFRTMNNNRGEDGVFLSDAERLTKFGRFLRSTSLDELLELFNIIKGEMSIIGPRPLLIQYLDRYTPEQLRRHEVKPGLTGWAQVNGRNAISWEEKFKLDVWYVDNQSIMLDIKIICLTIWKILKREGINQEGQATMEEFMGSN